MGEIGGVYEYILAEVGLEEVPAVHAAGQHPRVLFLPIPLPLEKVLVLLVLFRLQTYNNHCIYRIITSVPNAVGSCTCAKPEDSQKLL